MIIKKEKIQTFLENRFVIEDYSINDFKLLKTQVTLQTQEIFCENDKDKEYISEIGYYELFEEIGIKSSYILGFEYQSIGPMSWFNSLSKIDCGGDYFYIEQFVDEQEPTIIAAIHKKKYRELLKIFLINYYESNGTQYGEHEMFSSLPSCTEIYDKNIDTGLMKECFRIFLDNITAKYNWHGSWHDEQKSMLEILENPEVYERSMKKLENLRDINFKDKDFLIKYLTKVNKEREEGLSKIDEDEKEDILKLLIYYKVKFK